MSKPFEGVERACEFYFWTLVEVSTCTLVVTVRKTMSFPRRRQRLRGFRALFDGRCVLAAEALAHVLVVTVLDHAVCCICGFSDEPLSGTPCCENAVQLGCMGDAPVCPDCDGEILGGDNVKECMFSLLAVCGF